MLTIKKRIGVVALTSLTVLGATMSNAAAVSPGSYPYAARDGGLVCGGLEKISLTFVNGGWHDQMANDPTQVSSLPVGFWCEFTIQDPSDPNNPVWWEDSGDSTAQSRWIPDGPGVTLQACAIISTIGATTVAKSCGPAN